MIQKFRLTRKRIAPTPVDFLDQLAANNDIAADIMNIDDQALRQSKVEAISAMY